MLRTQILDVSSHPSFDRHEQVALFENEAAGLKAIIAIHNTNLGPSLGGCRVYPYVDQNAALTDVLRLSRGMTYKSALAQLPLGGGKAVIIANPRSDKTEAMMEAFGEAVESLKGRYITAEDVGSNEEDMIAISRKTIHVAGLPHAAKEGGVSGNPSPVTAYGVYCGIRACVREKFGSDDLSGKKVAIQGLGAVGYALAQYLYKDGADLIVADLHQASLDRAIAEFGGGRLQIVPADEILSVRADIFAPCAMGAVLNDETIPLLEVGIVAGAANNQLAAPHHGLMLKERGILYAPDYAINSGGVTSVGYEYFARAGMNPYGYTLVPDTMRAHVAKIEDTLLKIFQIARERDISTGESADRLAEEIFLQRKAA
jgi:leucine dehydrogenase